MGGRIHQLKLAEQDGNSRTPLRDTLKVLANRLLPALAARIRRRCGGQARPRRPVERARLKCSPRIHSCDFVKIGSTAILEALGNKAGLRDEIQKPGPTGPKF